MIMHFDIRDKVMKILINIDCKVYRICIIRGNFCVRNLAKILLLWSLRKLLRWCRETYTKSFSKVKRFSLHRVC